MTEETLNDFFDIGNVDGYEPPNEDAYPLLEASKVTWEAGADGKRVRREEPRYLFRLTGPARKGKTRFGDDALIGRALSVYPAKKEPRRRVGIAIEIPRFKSKDEVRNDVLNDDNVPEHQKEERIESRIGGLGRAKGRCMLLAKALVGTDDIRTLSQFLQSPDAEGAYFAASVNVRTWDGGAANNFIRFYPASEATEPMPADN